LALRIIDQNSQRERPELKGERVRLQASVIASGAESATKASSGKASVSESKRDTKSSFSVGSRSTIALAGPLKLLTYANCPKAPLVVHGTIQQDSVRPRTIFRFIGDPPLKELRKRQSRFLPRTWEPNASRPRRRFFDGMKVFENMFRRFVIGWSKNSGWVGLGRSDSLQRIQSSSVQPDPSR